MTDDHKYSSLYSAIQSLDRRPKRSSEASSTSREGSSARRESSSTRRESYTARPLRTSASRRTPPAGSVLKIPHVIENEDDSFVSPASPAGSVLKIPHIIENEDADASPLPHALSRQVPASSFFTLDPIRRSRAPTVKFDNAARLSTSPRSPSSPPFTNSNRDSRAGIALPRVSEIEEEYNQSQPHASRLPSQKARLSIVPDGTTRSSRTSGRQSQFVTPGEAEKSQDASAQQSRFSVSPSIGTSRRSRASAVQDVQGGRISQFMTPGDSEEPEEVPRHASTQQGRFSVSPTRSSTRISKASGIYDDQGGRASQLMISDEAKEPQESLMQPSTQQTRFSVPPDTTGGSRASLVYHGQGGRASQFMIPGEAEEPNKTLLRSSTQQAGFSDSTRGSRASGVYDDQGGRASQFIAAGEAEEPQEALTGSSTQQARFSVPPTRASRASAVYDGQGGRESQLMAPRDAGEPQEVLMRPSTQQARFSVPPSADTSRGSRASGVYDGQGGGASQFVTPGEPQEVLTWPSTQQARFSVPPTRGSSASGVYDGQGGGGSQFMTVGEGEEPQEALMHVSAQEAMGSIPALLDANRSSRVSGIFDGQGERDSESMMLDEGEEPREAFLHAPTEQAQFSISPRLDAKRSSRASGFYDDGRESQFRNPDEVMMTSRMSSIMPARTSSQKRSSVAVPGSEAPEAPQKVSFSIPIYDADQQSRIPEPFIGQDDNDPSPHLSSQGARASSRVVDRTESFLRVPSVLEPKDKAFAIETPAMEGTSRNLSPRASAQRSRMFSSSLSQSPRASGQNRPLQMIDYGGMPSNRVSSLSPPSSQVEAEWSPRSGSSLRIPSVMDNEPDMSQHASSFADANRGSRTGSSFANPEMFEHVDSRGNQSLAFPGTTRPTFEGVDVQASRASRQGSRFSSPEQRSRTGSPSHKFSQFSRSSSVLPSIGNEGEISVGSRVYSMPSDPVRTSLPGSFQSVPSTESEGEAAFHTSLRRPTAGFSPPMSFPMTRSQDSQVYFEPQPQEFLPEGDNVENSMAPLGETTRSRGGSFCPDVPRNTMAAEEEPHLLFDDLEQSENVEPLGESPMRGSVRPSHMFEQFPEQAPNFSSTAPFDSNLSSRAKSFVGQGFRESQALKRADSMSPRASNQPLRSSFETSLNRGSKMSSFMLPQDFEYSTLDSARSSQAGTLPARQQYMPMLAQDAEPQVVAVPQQEEDAAADGEGQAMRYDGMASPRISGQPSRSSSVAALGSSSHQDPYNQVEGDFDSMPADTGIPSLSSTEISRTPSFVYEFTDVNGSQRRGSSFMQANVAGEAEVPAFSSGVVDASGTQPTGHMEGSLLATDPNSTESSLMPNQYIQRQSSLSFSKQIQKRSSLGAALTSRGLGENAFRETGNSTSDSSSEELVQDKRLSLESVSRPSFSAKLSEQQSMVRPWDTEERRMSQATYGTPDIPPDDYFEDPNYTTLTRPESADADGVHLRTFTENDPSTFEGGLDQRPSESTYAVQPFGLSEYTDQQGEERARGFLRVSFPQDTYERPDIHSPDDQQGEERSSGSLRASFPQNTYETPGIHSPDSFQDPEKLHSLSTKSGRKSLVQEFIYPTSPPRQSFQESISPRQSFRESVSPTADQRESLRQEGSFHSPQESISPRQSFISPRADQRKSFRQEGSYQSISPRRSVWQSFDSSKKDLTELQTQEFMYSPSLARTMVEHSLDQGQDQALQSLASEMDAAELPNQELMYSPPSARQLFERVLPEEDVHEEVQYEDPAYSGDSFQDPIYSRDSFQQDEDPTYSRDFLQQNIEEGETHPSLQQQSSTILSRAYNGDDLNDEECFDNALEAKQHNDSEDLLLGDSYDIIEDQLSPPPKDDLHSESFTNLEDSLGSFKRAFGSSASFIRVPFGASELSYEGFANSQFMEPTAGVWPVVWRSVAMQDLIRFTKDPLTQPLLQRLAAAPHKQCAVTSFTHLLAYMGDVPTQQDLVYHMQQILMLGIKFSDFRDEIFCHICKQTTANPSRWSNGRGWQAMALCVGTFAPTSTFRPFLEAHLQQVAGHFVGQWAGDTMSYQDEGMSNPSKAAEYCLTRFQKLMQAGSRRLPPLHAEINVVEVLDLDPMATAEEVTTQLAQMNGLWWWDEMILGPSWGVWSVGTSGRL